MKDSVRERLTARSQVFKALGHPSRLLMIDALRERPHFVGELRERVGSRLATVSRHLNVLKEAGVVAERRRGLRVYYELCNRALPGLLGSVEQALRERAGHLRRLSRGA